MGGLSFSLMRRGQAPLVGWFGKLPAIGDFAGRGLPSALREQVHAWCAEGMGRLAEQHGQTWKAAYQLAPVWHFAMNANIWDARPLVGCVAPSMDCVGRCSPVVALRSVDAARMAECLPPQSRWLFDVEALLRRLVQGALGADAMQAELEAALEADSAKRQEGDSAGDILSDLGIATGQDPNWFSWPDLAERFCERKGRSFWWAEPSPRQPPRQVIHNGTPDDELFELLMAGWADMPKRGHMD
jgi:type VI secretion system protein ImpM